LEQCYASFSIISFQQIAGIPPVSLLEQSCAGLDLGLGREVSTCENRQVTHSPGRIGYASGTLPYNRLSSNIARPLESGRFADYTSKWKSSGLPTTRRRMTKQSDRSSHDHRFAGNLERSAIQNSRLRLPRGQFDHSRHYESAACTLGNAPLSELTYGQADKAVVS
jgi:hypothetical protein